MLNDKLRDAFHEYLDQVVERIESDAASKNLKLPAQGFRKVDVDEGVQLMGAPYFKYLVLGRGPGKQPPPDAMLNFVRNTPGLFESAKQRFEKITEKSLAFLIGRSIGEKGTAIYRGLRPGIGFLEALDGPLDKLLKTIARNEAIQIVTALKHEFNRQ